MDKNGIYSIHLKIVNVTCEFFYNYPFINDVHSGEDYIYRGDFYHESKSEPHVEEQLVAAIYDLISKYKVNDKTDNNNK